MIVAADALPIEPVLPTLREALATAGVAVLQAPPGAGKTTRVPLALLDEPWLRGRRILMLEPRRLAARAAAHRMAETVGEAPGGLVGYRIRHETRVGPRTRLEVVTEGVRASPPGRRKVVLATSIAETSLTIDGVQVVVDGGWSRVPRYSPRSGMTRLVTVRVSRASADQRRGRAGRQGPGVCYRLWPGGRGVGAPAEEHAGDPGGRPRAARARAGRGRGRRFRGARLARPAAGCRAR